MNFNVVLKVFFHLIYIYIYIYLCAFANGPGDLGSIPGRVIPKTLKIVLDTSLLNTQQYNVLIEGKVGYPGKGVAPSPTLLLKREPSGCPPLQSPILLSLYIYICTDIRNQVQIKVDCITLTSILMKC